MHYRNLKLADVVDYAEDILKCYHDNSLIFDSQNPILMQTSRDAIDFIYPYVDSKDSIVIGIFDDYEIYLYGIIIFDNIRCADKLVAEVHIAICKDLWGKKALNILKEIASTMLFDVVYCTIPQIAVNVIGVVKKMGFKKTGYIPCALPYKNSKGEEKLYDLNIFCYRNESV